MPVYKENVKNGRKSRLAEDEHTDIPGNEGPLVPLEVPKDL